MDVDHARHHLWFSLLLVAVAGCSATDSMETEPSVSASTTPTTTTSTPTTTTAVDEVGEGPLYLRPIDPTTLKDIPGKAQLGVGGATWAAVSPNGGWLAVVAYRTPEGGEPLLTLVDTRSWSWSDSIAIPELEPISSLAVTDQGTVVWIHSPGDHPYVYRLPKGVGKPTLVADLGESRWPIVQPTEVGLLTEAHLILLSYAFDGESYGGFLHLLRTDLETGEITDLPLGDVWHGHIPTADIDLGQPFAYEPGWALDEPRAVLYVVPAQDDEVIVVDLVTMDIRQRERWDEAESLLDRWLAWWIPAARAKGGVIAQRQLALSPDGSRLFIATLTPGSERIDVIDTETFQLMASSDFTPMRISLSPDGSILLATDSFQPEGTGSETIDAGSLHLLDPESLETRAQILPDLDFYLNGYSGFSADGRYAYVWNYAPETDALLYVAIDLTDPRAVAIRKVYWPGFAIPQAGVLVAADR